MNNKSQTSKLPLIMPEALIAAIVRREATDAAAKRCFAECRAILGIAPGEPFVKRNTRS